MVGLSQKLTSLVKAAPPLLPYVLINLGRNVFPRPGQDHGFFRRVQSLRNQLTLTFIKSVTTSSLVRAEDPLQEIERQRLEDALLEIGEKALTTKLFQASSLNLFLKKLSVATPELLRTHVGDKDPFVRLLVISTISRRRLHLEKELIERLDDGIPIVREAAHRALVRVARGTDFGPRRGASHTGIARAIAKWSRWQVLQESESPEMIAKRAAQAALGKRSAIAPLDIASIIFDGKDRPELAEAGKISEELVNAKGDDQQAVLARMLDSKVAETTDALALAIPKVSGDIQRQARDALTQRLARMTANMLREKLQDDNLEVRRAAALACALKYAKERIPDLLQLLDDPEMDVIQSARQALTELTGEDLGPPRDAPRLRRAEATAAWRKWWKKQQEEQK